MVITSLPLKQYVTVSNTSLLRVYSSDGSLSQVSSLIDGETEAGNTRVRQTLKVGNALVVLL